MAQLTGMPDLEAQRAAMNKLSFLTGRWSGEAHIFQGAGDPLELIQAEEAQYKLGGLVLMVEGVGRNKADGKAALQALAVLSYDDDAHMYHMRAYNDGRYLETQFQLTGDGKGMTWGFSLGEIKTNSILRIDEKGDWTELHQIAIGSQAARKFMELRVRRQE